MGVGASSIPSVDFVFSKFLLFFKCLYHFSLNDLKYETFTLERRGSKVSLGIELDHGPLRPFEKNSIKSLVFIK